MQIKAIVSILMILSATQSFAGTLAEVSTYGGFTPVPLPRYGLRIEQNGDILSYKGEAVTKIAKLSSAKTSALIREINQVHPAKLVEENPDAPICVDAPTTSYKIMKADSTTIEVAKNQDCKLSVLSNGEGRLLKEILEGLNKLTHLSNH